MGPSMARPPLAFLLLIPPLIAGLMAGCASFERSHALQRATDLSAEAAREGGQGRLQSAVQKAREALALRERVLGPADPRVAGSLDALATLLREAADYHIARPLYERAVRIREQALGPDHPAVADTLNRLAWLLQAQADYAAARPLYERALSIHTRAFGPDHPAVAWDLHNFAVLHGATGDATAAIPMHERALRLREQALGPNHPVLADSLNSLGQLLNEKGRYAEARPLLERALAIRERALDPAHPAVAASLGNLGALFREMGDYPRARPLLERALRLREQALGPGHPLVAVNLARLASLFRVTGDHAAALPLLERTLAIREQALGPHHPAVASSLSNIGRLLSDIGRYAEATPLYERAIEIREQALGLGHGSVAHGLNGLGQIRLATGDYTGGRPLFERALAIARAVPAPGARWRAAIGLGSIHEREGRLTEALPLFQEAVKTIEEVASQFGEEGTRLQFLQAGDRFGPYEALARVLLKLHEQAPSKGYDQEAWAVLGARKGRLVAELLTAARPEPQDPRVREEAREAQAKQDQVLALEAALREEEAKPAQERQPVKVQNLTTLLAQTKAGYVSQARAFLARYPQYKTQFVDQQTVDPRVLAKFSDRLPAGTLAVQYFAAPDSLYLFVVAPGGRFQVKTQAVSQAELYGLIREYRRLIQRAAQQRLDWASDGSEIYRSEVLPLKEVSQTLATHLVGPIRGELEQYHDLVLIPNDLLLYVPIHALTLDGPGGSGRFLAETHAVSYLTQLELVELLNPSKPGENARLLALANPDGSLPGASREVREIVRFRPSTMVLEGAEATKARFLALAGDFADLHLATHAILDSERPERSFLLVAGDDESSQRLGIGEIAGLRLPPTGLAILSACETALGEQVPGAALVTLAAAFSQAGAQSVVASLWKVEDAATRDFMVAFHRALATRGRVDSLREAQVTLTGNPKTAHPYYWAAFILIGAR